jgi:hypothetical protein
MLRLAIGLAALSLMTAGQALAVPALTPADKTAAFKAAGFKARGAKWIRCEDDPSASAMPGQLEVADLNGDGAPEAWITDSSVFCYGNTAEAFVLVTKTPAGWKVLLDEVGVPTAQAGKHNGWPDIKIGGPGSGPFPVYRFNGTVYAAGR